jgi:chromatin remodeling complex protein RSC6
MATSVLEIDTHAIAKVDSSDNLKNVLTVLTEQSASIKNLMNTVRSVIKENDRMNKELEKLRNKRSRVKTERVAGALPSGITKPVAISDELAIFLGVAPGTLVPRNEVTKGVSGFVKVNDLSDPSNKQRFILDDRPAAKKLRILLGDPKEDVTYFNLQRYLKHHYIIDINAPVATPKKKNIVIELVSVPIAAAPIVAEAEAEKPKKKVMMVKKKKTELTEEA